MSKNNKPTAAIKSAADLPSIAGTKTEVDVVVTTAEQVKDESTLTPEEKARIDSIVDTVLGDKPEVEVNADESDKPAPEDAARAVMEANAKAADEQLELERKAQADTKAAALADEAAAQAIKAAEAEELKLLSAQALARADALAAKDDVSIMVKTIKHELDKYLEIYSKSNIPVQQRIAQHSALIRLFDNVVKMQKAEDFIGSMDVILATYKANCNETQAFHEAVVNRYASEVSASMNSTLAFQFFIYLLSVVATHHSKVIPTNFAKDISREEFGKHFPGVNGERLLLWATRMCQ